MVALTIGMATYKDFDGCYFTIQALRHYQDMTDTELVVVDNFGDPTTKEFVEGWARGRYILATDAVGTAAPRDRVFREARGEAVLCCDSHVLFSPGVIARLKQYYADHPGTRDFLQGPLLYDDLVNLSTHFQPEWRGQMWGTWGTDPRGTDPDGEPFDIPMQGLGAFSCLRAAWPGFNPRFRGFGGEEGYIHEKFRQRGGRTLCLPWFRWNHRFARPAGVPYPLYVEDKFRNYVIGHTELGLDLTDAIAHFRESLPQSTIDTIIAEIRGGSAGGPIISSGFTPLNDDSVSPGNAAAPAPIAAAAPPPSPEPAPVVVVPAVDEAPADDQPYRRAVVTFVDGNKHIIQQLLALRESWLFIEADDTDLVVMGPEEILATLPDDLVKIPQRPATDNPVWQGQRSIDPIASLNGDGATRLNRYTHLLRTDPGAFLTPAWNDFRPDGFSVGAGGPMADDAARASLARIAADYGLTERGYQGLRTTWYGRTEDIRRAAAIAELLAKYILTQPTPVLAGQPDMATAYACELAINHYFADVAITDALDADSTSTKPTDSAAHIRAGTTARTYSKDRFIAGLYSGVDPNELDIDTIGDFCLSMAMRSMDQLASVGILIPSQREHETGGTRNSDQERDDDEPDPGEVVPLISCLCPTYNRAPSNTRLLEEAIESFLRQDYPNKELIVLNDCPEQELICNAPGVRVFNFAERFRTLGEKRNALSALANGEFLVPWDDDDIHLPWRLSFSIDRLGDADYFNPRRFWFMDGNGLHRDPAGGVCHNASIMRRSAFEKVGGYANLTLGEDARIDHWLSRLQQGWQPPDAEHLVREDELFYIYRWGVSPVHVSGRGDESFYTAIGNRPIVAGRFDLQPHWACDYAALIDQLLSGTARTVRPPRWRLKR